jgi:hypothetical protein
MSTTAEYRVVRGGQQRVRQMQITVTDAPEFAQKKILTRMMNK